MTVRVHVHQPIDLQDGAVVVAFPSFGLVATLAVVEDGEPHAPVRIYAGRLGDAGKPLALVLSEFQPDPPLVRGVARAILDWAREQGAGLVVSPEGLLVDEELSGDNVVEVYGAASDDAWRDRLRGLGAPLFRNGLVAGVTGVLLTAGKREGVPVVGILSEADPDQPDARSAAIVVDLLGQLLDVELDTSGLYDEADRFARRVQEAMRMQQMHEREKGHSHSVMYG